MVKLLQKIGWSLLMVTLAIISFFWTPALYLLGVVALFRLIVRAKKIYRYFKGLRSWKRYTLLTLIGGALIYFLIWLFTAGVVNVRTVQTTQDNVAAIAEGEPVKGLEVDVELTEAFKAKSIELFEESVPETLRVEWEVYGAGSAAPKQERYREMGKVLEALVPQAYPDGAKTGDYLSAHFIHNGGPINSRSQKEDLTPSYIYYIQFDGSQWGAARVIDEWLLFQDAKGAGESVEEYSFIGVIKGLVTNLPQYN